MRVKSSRVGRPTRGECLLVSRTCRASLKQGDRDVTMTSPYLTSDIPVSWSSRPEQRAARKKTSTSYIHRRHSRERNLINGSQEIKLTVNGQKVGRGVQSAKWRLSECPVASWQLASACHLQIVFDHPHLDFRLECAVLRHRGAQRLSTPSRNHK